MKTLKNISGSLAVILLALGIVTFTGGKACADSFLYYNTGRVKAMIPAVVKNGIVKYEYYNEKFYNLGKGISRGRIIRVYFSDGRMLYFKKYFGKTDVASVIEEYGPARVLVNTYTCYVSGNIKEKVLLSPRDGIKKYVYYDEGFYTMDGLLKYGRVKNVYMSDGRRLLYAKYFKGTDKAEIINEYDKKGKLAVVYTYDISGKLLSEARYNAIVKKNHSLTQNEPVVTTYTYYVVSSRLESRTMSQPDADGNSYYHYLDEDWNGQGNARVDKVKRSAANEKGERSFKYLYYDGTDKVRVKYSYTDTAFSKPSARYCYSQEGKLASYQPYSDVKYIEYSITNSNADGNWRLSISSNGDVVWNDMNTGSSKFFYYRGTDNTLNRLIDSGMNSTYSYISKGGDVVWVSDLGDGYSINYYKISGTPQMAQIFENHSQAIGGLSAWHMDNLAPRMSPNGRYIVWINYQASSCGGEVYLYDTATGSTTKVTNDGFRYRRVAVDDNGNMVWQDNISYAGNVYMRRGSDGLVKNLSADGNRIGWDPQINNGYIVWQSNGDIMHYDIANDVRINLEPIGGYGVHDWDPVLNARGDVAWKGGPLWEGTDIYVYDRASSTVKRLIQDDTQDAVININDKNGFLAWIKHFPDGRKNLYFYDGIDVVLVAEGAFIAGGYGAFQVSDYGDLIWVEQVPGGGSVIKRYDYKDRVIEIVASDYRDTSGMFAMNAYGDIAWRTANGIRTAKAYTYTSYVSGNVKRCMHPSGEVIEYYDEAGERTSLGYDPVKKEYSTYDRDAATGISTVKVFSGVYTVLADDPVRKGVKDGELVSETRYFADGKVQDKKEYFYDADGALVRTKIFTADTGRSREYIPGKTLPVTVLAGGLEYKKIYGSAGNTTLTLEFYEDWPPLNDPWGAFKLGRGGENVYLLFESCGSKVKRILVYMSASELDIETGVDWSSPIKINNAEYLLQVLKNEAPDGNMKNLILTIDLGASGITTRDELVTFLKDNALSHGYTEKEVDALASSVGEKYPDIASDSLRVNTVYELDPMKFSIYDVAPHFAIGEPGKKEDSYPFTYYPSGRVRTMFGKTQEEGYFTRSEEASGKIYEYADESFYPEVDTACFLSDLIYTCPGKLADEGLKYFLTQLDIVSNSIDSIDGLLDYLYDNAVPANNYTSGDVEELLLLLSFDEPYREHGRLLTETNKDGSYITFKYEEGSDKIKETDHYDINGSLIERRVAVPESRDFILMGSMPWIRYGEGIGKRHSDDWHSGYSRVTREGSEELTGYEELHAALKKWEGTTVRIFLFGDMRCGLTFDANNNFTGFTDCVIEDMAVLLKTAKELDIKLIPVLFDYRMADKDDAEEAEEHVNMIKNSSQTEELLEHFDWFFREVSQLADYDAIYAWDVMNEPEISCEGHKNVVTTAEMTNFVRKFIDKIHDVDEDAKVTVGSLTKSDMIKNWVLPDNALAEGDNAALDIYQFHYYDSSSEWHDNDIENLDFHSSSLGLYAAANDTERYFNAPNYLNGKLVIVGELDPTYVSGKLDTLANAGYDGALFWDDKGNILNATELQEAKDWFSGAVYTYYPTGCLRTSRVPCPDGTGSEFKYYINESYYPSGLGRVFREVKAEADEYGAKAYEYEYYWGGDTPSVKRAYHSVSFTTDTLVPDFADPVYTMEFDAAGDLIPERTVWDNIYYEDSWLKMADADLGKYYLNENWESRGYGREIIEVRDGRAYIYSVLKDQYQRFGQWEWGSIDLSDPLKPHFSGFVKYNGGWNGSSVDYYNPGDAENIRRMKSRTLPGGDNWGNEYYHYINESLGQSWNWMGCPRADVTRLSSVNAKGERSFVYAYYTDSVQASVVRSYASAGYVPGDFTGQETTAVYEYDAAGRLTTVSFKEANAKSERAFEYEYNDGSDAVKTVRAYADRERTELLHTYEYDESGNLIEETGDLAVSGENSPKGVSIDEVVSKQSAIQENRTDFTGYSVKPEEQVKTAQSV